jgi:hypothetical protein
LVEVREEEEEEELMEERAVGARIDDARSDTDDCLVGEEPLEEPLDECMGFGGDDWCIGLAGEREELQTKWSKQWEDEDYECVSSIIIGRRRTIISND